MVLELMFFKYLMAISQRYLSLEIILLSNFKETQGKEGQLKWIENNELIISQISFRKNNKKACVPASKYLYFFSIRFLG